MACISVGFVVMSFHFAFRLVIIFKILGKILRLCEIMRAMYSIVMVEAMTPYNPSFKEVNSIIETKYTPKTASVQGSAFCCN